MKNSSLEKVLESYNPISLAEMDEVKLLNRVETKFVFTKNHFAVLLSQLSPHYSIVEIDNQVVHNYENLYFDDANLFLYNEHHRGRPDRFKVRYRKYVDSNLMFFEIKHKRKGKTAKMRVKVTEINEHLGTLEKQLLKESDIPRLDLLPVTANSYKRITLVNKTSIERLTFDIDLVFKQNGKEAKLGDIVIAELKQERITRSSPFYKLARQMQLRPFRVSKYCTGLIQMAAPQELKYNRFKKKLIHLNKLSDYGVHMV
ncbi:polyphosphate polymerase domain-containing protein [Vicingaceae bacterium]|nr:polyphosphate polymerase domain-containing protein [Vicingaceae bacterium]MDB4062193.1 polyphosphate polymerase domain-containing protein [Vicingaceae bacterium]MDC1451570.1 polyphosphate polymerase domain-containing protein [Vicingaceae bacterium]